MLELTGYKMIITYAPCGFITCYFVSSAPLKNDNCQIYKYIMMLIHEIHA